MLQGRKRVFVGSFVHSLSLRKLEYLRNTLLAVDEQGVIAFIVSDKPASASTNGEQEQQQDKGIQTQEDVQFILSQQGWDISDTQVVWLKRGDFIIPGYGY
jgi:guanine deaminase